MPLKPEDLATRIYAEILRRKGLSVKDAQLMRGEPWYSQLTWNAAEEKSFERWIIAFFKRELSASDPAIAHARWVWKLNYSLHRRDGCDYEPHDEQRERDRPRSKWLPVKKAMETLPRDQWPDAGNTSARRKGRTLIPLERGSGRVLPAVVAPPFELCKLCQWGEREMVLQHDHRTILLVRTRDGVYHYTICHGRGMDLHRLHFGH
jgi:hypothetical protein